MSSYIYTITANSDTAIPIPRRHDFSVVLAGTPDTSTAAVQLATGSPVAASLTTALTGADGDLIFTARKAGTAGNAITVAYIAAAGADPLSVTCDNGAIVVNLVTAEDGGTITTTAAEIAAAIAAQPGANALVSVANAAGNDGTGVVTAMAATALASGTNGTFTTVQSGTGGEFTAAGELVATNGGRSDFVNVNVSSVGASTSWDVTVTDLGSA